MKSLYETYRYPGFTPEVVLGEIEHRPSARVVRLQRSQKKQFAEVAARFIAVGMTKKLVELVTYPVVIIKFILNLMFVESTAEAVRP